MENRIYGVITICVVSFLYLIAYKKFQKEKVGLSLMLIIASGLILRIFTSCDFYLHEWDERYHALVARNLIDSPWVPMLYANPILAYDYTEWWANHIWVHKQPVPLYSMALSMWIFGKNVIALRLPSIFLSSVAIFSTYKVASYLSSKRVALLAAFLFSINGLIIEQTAGRVATDHIDAFFFSLISIAVFLFFRSTNKASLLTFIFASIVTALAILTKWLPALIVLPLWILYSYKEYSWRTLLERSMLFVLIVSIVVIPWQWYIESNFPLEAMWEYGYNRKHFTGGLGHDQPFYYHFNRMRVIFGELIYLPLIWLLYEGMKCIKKMKKDYEFSQQDHTVLLLLLWILIPYIFFSCVITKMQGYILFCSPAIFIMTALFLFKVKDGGFIQGKFKYVILFLLIALPIRYSIERISPFSIENRSPEWAKDYKALGAKYKGEKVVVFDCEHPIEMMFYTGFTAYERSPNESLIDSLEQQGYILVNSNGR